MEQSVGVTRTRYGRNASDEPASEWRSPKMPVTRMGRAKKMTGLISVVGDRMLHQIKRCELGRPCSWRETAGSQSFHSSEEA